MKIKRTLYLTSPFMTGSDVKHVQAVLNGANFLHHDYYGGQVDGEAGPVTLMGAKQAKFWLGYKDLDPAYGQKLENYLTGDVPLPADYAARRARRIAAAAHPPAHPKGEQLLDYLRGHLGETEFPAGSNHVPWASDWYAVNGPWCAMGYSRAAVVAGFEWFQRGVRYSYVPYMVNDARQGRGLEVVSFKMAQPGDAVAFDWDGGVADHVGAFVKRLSATTFETIECNTSPDDHGSQSNGGGCYRKTRNVSLVEAFMHPIR